MKGRATRQIAQKARNKGQVNLRDTLLNTIR